MTASTAASSNGPRLALGSWHIFSRLTLAQSIELVQAAIQRGITLFDIGDYWDHETLNTQRFREVVAHLGLPRDSYQIAVKLFTNSSESREQVLRKYLDRLGLEHVDYANCSRPTQSETLEGAVEAMGALVSSGLSRGLALGLWDAPLIMKAYPIMKERKLAVPTFVQFQYNVCRRDVIESEAFTEMVETTGVRLQAAFTLEGGVLAGHVHRRRYGPEDRARGEWFADRNIARDSGDIREKIYAVVPRLQAAAATVGLSAAQLAMAFSASNPHVHSVLFGASTVAQLDEAVGALEFSRTHRADILALVDPYRVHGTAPPRLFDYAAGVH